MKLKTTHGWGSKLKPVDIERAIREELDDSVLSEGELERMRERLHELAKMFSRLLERLEANGMRPDHIAEIIGYRWEAVADPEPQPKK